MRTIEVIDSHTEGEPTRVVIAGGPDLGIGTMAERLARFRAGFDRVRSAIVNEPRGWDALVGALLCEDPADKSAAAGVIFFNNVGFLNMCGHGAIGLIATLAHLGRIKPGVHKIETPVGTVSTTLHELPRAVVSIENVPSYRFRKAVEVSLPDLGTIRGDVAWGGNWFFLCDDHGQDLEFENRDRLTDVAWRIRKELAAQGVTGEAGKEIDHIELFGPPSRDDCHSRNFVLCPGRAYDRSPCGTGTSAKLACLFADGKIKSGDIWRQESIIGSAFSGSVREENGAIIPTITGRAWITAKTTLMIDETDPFADGIIA